jgi:hypothetical protein
MLARHWSSLIHQFVFGSSIALIAGVFVCSTSVYAQQLRTGVATDLGKVLQIYFDDPNFKSISSSITSERKLLLVEHLSETVKLGIIDQVKEVDGTTVFDESFEPKPFLMGQTAGVLKASKFGIETDGYFEVKFEIIKSDVIGKTAMDPGKRTIVGQVSLSLHGPQAIRPFGADEISILFRSTLEIDKLLEDSP